MIEDWYSEHRVHAALERLTKSSTTAVEKAADADGLDAANRLSRVAERAKAILGAVEPDLVARGTLENLANRLASLSDRADQFASGGALSLIGDDASDDLGAALQALSALAVAYQRPTSEPVQDQATTFKRSVGQLLAGLQTEIDSTKQRAAASKTSVEELDARVKSLDSQVTAMVTEHQDAFRSAELTRSKAAEDQFAERVAAFRQRQEELEADWIARRAALDKEAQDRADSVQQRTDELVAEIEQQRDDVDEIIALISDAALTGQYAAAATADNKSASKWRGIAVAFYLGAVLFVAAALVVWPPVDFSIERVLTRVGVGLIIAAPGAYAASESREHRRSMRENQRLAIELKAIGPFLETNVSDAQSRSDLAKAMSDRFFRGHVDADRTNDVVRPSDLVAMLQKTLDRALRR